jgi:hypothetical protein
LKKIFHKYPYFDYWKTKITLYIYYLVFPFSFLGQEDNLTT